MTAAAVRDLARQFPGLWHMTEAGAGERIRAEGLWSTSALLDRAGIDPARREVVEASRRSASVTLPDGVVIRDNGVLSEAKLAALLPEGVMPRDWYRLLNAHVFLWPSLKRCEDLLGAKLYKNRAHDLLEFDAASLLAAHAGRVRLNPINMGATFYAAPARGPETFTPLSRWPLTPHTPYWGTSKGELRPVVEVAIEGGIPDASRHMVRILRRRHGEEAVTLWCREGVSG